MPFQKTTAEPPVAIISTTSDTATDQATQSDPFAPRPFYIPTYEECEEIYREWQKNGCIGTVPGLALFIFNCQPESGSLSIETWRNFLQLAANDIAQQAIDSLM